MDVTDTTRQDSGRAERLLLIAGPTFTALLVAAAVAFPMAPGGDGSPAADPAWLAEHVDAVIAQGYLRAAAALAFVVLVIGLAGSVRHVVPHRSVFSTAALAGGTLTGGMMLLAQAATLGAAMLAHAGGAPGAIRALAASSNAALDLSSLPAAILFTAVGTAAAQARLLPRWLTALTLLGVPVALLDALSYDGGPLEDLGVIGLVFFLAWSLLIGGALLARPAQTRI